ncbi:alpha/beta hydrolase [Steroidobacter sp.]|uniref:alpha/beta hydrolase n=1 Tax=Steroidobacter sp. TaxID=1978227 RepID=UPI001A6118B7|nr:alpha/beta hydrolase [Steroidobacter sp.]MBL8270736.1 alpha/beta hydrolase [Steroidobacter sp.]
MKLGRQLGAAVLAALLNLVTTQVRAEVVADIAAAPVLDDHYPSAKVSFGTDVESYPDVVFSTLQGFRPLRLDIYRQVASNTPRPLVIYIHGGGWQSGHTRHAGAFSNWPSVLASLARKGYVVASIEYRLSSEAKFPAAIQDVKTAIKWLRASAKKYSIDTSKTIVWGGSAGGQLAALAATSCGVEALAPEIADKTVAAQSDCVQGLVAWYGVFDFSTIPELNSGANSPGNRYLGCSSTQCADKVALASPIAQLDSKDPPTLLIHGETDKVVPANQSRAFDAALRAKGVPSELIVIPAVDHSFIGSTPEATRQASLQALSKTFAFIDAVSGGKRE